MSDKKNFQQNTVEYYNKGEYRNNKEEYIPNGTSSLLLGRTSSLASPLANVEVESLDSKPTREVEPLDSGAAEAAPLGPHNVKRVLIQLFGNKEGRKLKVRINLADDTNVEFIAPMQPKSDLTNFLRYTGEFKDFARDWFTSIRKKAKQEYGVNPQQGKFHLNGGRKTKKTIIQVEPECYGAIVYNAEVNEYVVYLKLYDLWIMQESLSCDYLTDNQKKTNVRGQRLWINPIFDTRVRPLTWAEKRKRGLA